jgi:hypothetical protein
MTDIKFGKLPPKIDKRTIKFRNILAPKLPAVPAEYDIDKELSVVDNNMYLNDIYGDCVIASRAHHTLRFEMFEQKKLISISDNEVKDEYFKETGGIDSGLVMLDSLNHWRKDGWVVGGKTYTIHAYASVDWKNHDQVKHGVYLLTGVYFGMLVPQSAIDQFKAGKIWEVTGADGGIQGGHAVYVPAFLNITSYNQVGPVIVTWGKRIQATWEFWDKYVEECYVIIDNKDDWLGTDSPIDIPKLEGYLSEITNAPVNPEPTNPGCLFKFWPFRRR